MGNSSSANRNNTARMNVQAKPAIDANPSVRGGDKPKIALEDVYESLEEYKEAVNNVYSLSRLMDDYADEIRDKLNDGDENPINSVLLTTLHEGYTKETAKSYCEVIELGINLDTVRHARVLFSCKQYEELDGHSIWEMRNSRAVETVDGLSIANMGNLLEVRILDVSKRLPAYGNTHIYTCLGQWTKGVRLYFNLLRKHPILDNKWIVVSSGVDMSEYTKTDTSDLRIFSPEYKRFMESITQAMNSNAYIKIIEESARMATDQADQAVAILEEKNALYTFARQVLENAPRDAYAKSKEQQAKLEAQSASRVTAAAVTNAKAAQYTLSEAEAHMAMKTTTWEYGTSDTHNSLRCVYSGTNPQWNGMYITDCVLPNSETDIAGITLSVISDIEHYYHDLYHGQVILSTYKINDIYYTAVVNVIVRGDEIHLQMKEAQLNPIFATTSQIAAGQFQSGVSSQYIFVDPVRRYIGIGTNEYSAHYDAEYVTTTKDNGQNVVIQSSNYPNLVASRVAENSSHIPGGVREKNLYYFDQFSSATMRRQSNLYTFEQMYNYATEGGDQVMDYATMRKYGSNISFEIMDRSKRTKEIGNIGMVIDKIDEGGRILGGFSVKTAPDLVVANGNEIIKPGRTIMYVSNDGILNVKGVMLGSKELHVEYDEDGTEKLHWGEKQIC